MDMGRLENNFRVRKHINVKNCVIYNRVTYELQANKVLILLAKIAF